MRILCSRLSFFLLFLMVFPAVAQAAGDRRVALVIGNSAYQHTAVLQNPRHDAEDIAAALKRLNFEVMKGIDLDKRAMERIIRQFGLKLAGADIALFLYAGHGFQVSGQNYLLPIDARLSSEGDVDFEAIPLHLVLKQMEREAKTSLVLLDACRDNPLARNLARSMGTRSGQIGQGLAEVKTGLGTLIGFSTQPGNVAQDGANRNSPYAAALLRHLEVPGQDIGATLINVRTDVVRATDGRQVPWEHTSLMGRVLLAAPAPAEPSTDTYEKQMEIAFWNAIKGSRSPELLQTYVDRFPQGTFAGLARVLIQQAEKETAAHQEVARRDDAVKRAEEARAVAERQKREAERKAAETKLTAELRKAQEEARKAREALTAAEREREAALKAAAVARKEQEEMRKASETVVASLPSRAVPSGQPEAGSVPEAALVRSIQRELRRVGCDPGKEDGKWGPDVKGALERFARIAKVAVQSSAPTNAALAAIVAKHTRVCPLDCGDGKRAIGDRCVTVSTPSKSGTVTSSSARSPRAPRNKEAEFQACLQCCQVSQTSYWACPGLCWSRSPRIGSCFR